MQAGLSFGASSESSDHLPGPFTSRKAVVNNCAQSERISCKTAQMPILGGAGGKGNGEVPRKIEILVERMATIISPINGSAISLVAKPDSNSRPPTISRPPMKFAVKWGKGMPSLVKRPTPWLV